MYKKYKRLVYTPQIVGKILQSVKLVERQKFGLISFPRIYFPGLIYCDQEPLWLFRMWSKIIDNFCVQI